MSETSSQPAQGPAPADLIMQMATGYSAASCLNVAVQLKIADLVAAGPQPIAALARAAQANEDALYRVLRALAGMGIFTEAAPRTFANTPASELLREGTPNSIRPMVLWVSDALHLRVFAELMHSVRTGGTAIKKVTGSEAFEYFEQDKALGAIFHGAMSGFSGMMLPAVLEAYDFSGLGTLADIAGGQGVALTGILKKHANLEGILFDQPPVVADARQRIDSLGLASRCQVVGGDFFKAVPAADNYMLKHIIHDWDDARAAQILKNCVAAMRGPGKVILIESVIAPGDEPHFAKRIDIEMLAMAGGRERSETGFAALFSQAGLRLSRIVPTKSPVSVVEAVKT
jgi:hypothetical protein